MPRSTNNTALVSYYLEPDTFPASHPCGPLRNLVDANGEVELVFRWYRNAPEDLELRGVWRYEGIVPLGEAWSAEIVDALRAEVDEKAHYENPLPPADDLNDLRGDYIRSYRKDKGGF